MRPIIQRLVITRDQCAVLRHVRSRPRHRQQTLNRCYHYHYPPYISHTPVTTGNPPDKSEINVTFLTVAVSEVAKTKLFVKMLDILQKSA